MNDTRHAGGASDPTIIQDAIAASHAPGGPLPGSHVTDHDLRGAVFHGNAFAFAKALASTFNPSEKPGIMFEFVVEPVILRAESYQHASGPAVAGDYDLFGLR